MKKKSASKLKNVIIFLLVVLVVALVYKIYTKTTPTSVIQKETPAQVAQVKTTPITITIKKIKEENFSGTEPIIVGEGELATAARAFIDTTITDFRTQANTDVPDMRKKFGKDSPPATYTIDIEAKYKKGIKTDSIVMSVYMYTGGANGNSSYKVINASATTGKILSLSDIIKTDKQAAFVAYVKKQLNSWKPEGSTAPVVFPDAVKDLTFDSFSNWSLNDTNVVIYFDKYEIGPGVLGAVAFPVPVIKIKDFLTTTI